MKNRDTRYKSEPPRTTFDQPKNKPYLRQVKDARRGSGAPARAWKSWLEHTLAEKD
jgi:hypothetical protein